MVADNRSALNMAHAFRDITPERLIVLRRIADTVPIIVWKTDANNVCVSLNKAVQKIIGGLGNIQLTEWLQFVHPEDLQTVISALEHARAAEDDFQEEYRIVRGDGSICWMMSVGSPHFDADGQFAGYSGTTIDISDKYSARERITASESQYRFLATNSLDLICRCDPDGRYLYASPSYDTLGYSPDDLIGTDALANIHPDDAPLLRAEVARLGNATGVTQTIEVRKRRHDGSYVWMGLKIKRILNALTGEKLGSVSILRDISQERQAREDLRKSEERFRDLAEMSSDWVWETDADDTVIYMAESVHRALGITADAFVGRKRWDLTQPMDPAQLEVYVEKVGSRQPYRDLPFHFRHPLTGMATYITISGLPRYEDGEFRGFRGVGRNVTDLQRLIEENGALIENSLDVVAIMDAGGKFMEVRGAVEDVLGYTPLELIGSTYLDFVHPEDQPAVVSANQNLRLGDGKLTDFENRWKRRNGELAYLASSIHWMEDSDLHYITTRDVTKTYIAHQEQRKADHQLKMMLESLSDAFFAVDNDWRILYANAKAAAFVGIERDSAIGRTLLDVEPRLQHTPAFPFYLKAMEEKHNAQFEIFYEPANAWTETRIHAHEHGLSIFFQDITERRLAERKVLQNEQRFRQMIDITPAGYFGTNGDGIIQQVNPAFCTMTGYDAHELIGQHIRVISSFFPAEGQIAAQGGLTSVQGSDSTLWHKAGHVVHALINLAIERDKDGIAQSLSAFVTDISERKRAERQLEVLATHDTLTGLPNRAFINSRIQALLSGTPEEKSFAVMLIDLDKFKEVNDSMGHAAGDELLQQVATRLKGCLPPGDTVGRMGGDEFIVVASCKNGRESAATIAEKLLATFDKPVSIHDRDVFAGASIGVSMCSGAAATEEGLFQNADLAMYRAKSTGRNRYQFFELEMGAESKQRMDVEHALRRALERNEFQVYYQPRVNLHTLEAAGFEALLRWDNPELGRVPPSVFIPIAEDKGFITSIGMWVLEQACRDTKRLVDEVGHPMHVSVNLSAHQLKCQSLASDVERILFDTGLPANLLELEITESALIEDVEKSARTLKQLKQSGISVSIDDFGTGYSSLAYLKRFPVDILKLDRSFINQSPEGVNTLEFIKAVVGMAHSLNLSVVAEGVEIAEMLNLVSTANCDEVQGFLFAKPMPLGDLKTWLAARRSDAAAAEGNCLAR